MIIYTRVIILTTLFIASISTVHANNSSSANKGPHQRPSFESIDTNTDGDIDFEEFSSQKLPHGDHQAVFNSIDTNNSGVISQYEFNNHKPPHPKKGSRHD